MNEGEMVGQRSFQQALEAIGVLLKNTRLRNDINPARSPLVADTLHFMLIYDMIHGILEEGGDWTPDKRRKSIDLIGIFVSSLTAEDKEKSHMWFEINNLRALYTELTAL